MMNHEVMKSASEPYYESIGIFSRLNGINRNNGKFGVIALYATKNMFGQEVASEW